MKLCITGGGTGGHLMIAQALVEAAIADGHEVIFIGSTHGQDRKYFQGHSPFSAVYFLETTGVVNQKGFGKIVALLKVIRGFFQARSLLKQHKIQATYSVGGFSAAPASFATLSRFLPLFIHEQNAVEGRLNSLLKPYAKEFISAYDPASPIKGYPVKEVFFKTQRVRKKVHTIIFLGGSHGAKTINDLAISLYEELHTRGIKVIHQAGESDYTRVKNEYEKLGADVELYGFTKELEQLIQRADFALSRSGASTLWELTANGCPALYIPYPYAAGDHQYHNAKFLVEQNLASLAREDENPKELLLSLIENDFEKISTKLIELSKKDVAKEMIKNVVTHLQKDTNA